MMSLSAPSTGDPVPVALSARAIRVSYPGRNAAADVLRGISQDFLSGQLTAIVGPNGSGKSTLLHALARVLPPSSGTVRIEGRQADRLSGRELARSLALMPQQVSAPEGIRVWELVSRGRHPHRGFLRPLGPGDLAAIAEALELTGCADLADRRLTELSGGQRQRVWVALALAQQARVLLLDEPIAHLDLAYALDVLDIAGRLAAGGRAVVAVLHDFGLAARYADTLIVLDHGVIVAAGAPGDVLTAELVAEVFGVRAKVVPDPESGTPLVVPLASYGARR